MSVYAVVHHAVNDVGKVGTKAIQLSLFSRTFYGDDRGCCGRLLYRFKRPWRDGTTHIVLTAVEMLEKLAALVPAPKAHLVRYSGVLAPAAKWRYRIVPAASVIGGIRDDEPSLLHHRNSPLHHRIRRRCIP